MARRLGAAAFVVAAGAASLAAAAKAENATYLGFFDLYHAAFTSVGNFRGATSLYVTSFGVRDQAVVVVPEIGGLLGNVPAIQPTLLTDDVIWPNEVHGTPDGVFDREFLVVCGGFLVPTRETGQVYLMDVSQNTSVLYQISTDEEGYFYHMAEWYDMDGDGKLDILTAKATLPTDGSLPGGKLVWLQNPGTFQGPWPERVLMEGPDVFFRISDLDNDGRDEIVATQFFTERLTLLWNDGDFAVGADWRLRVIDDTLGAAFDVRVQDLNMDGRVELLVTNHQATIDESAVFAYEIPANIRTDPFVRHTLAQDFETRQPGSNQASPGSASAFYPVVNETSGKPWIVVSGDGTQRAYIMKPRSEDPLDWQYSLEELINVENTVGGISVGDVDGDGFVEIFVPNYDDGEVHVFTYGAVTTSGARL